MGAIRDYIVDVYFKHKLQNTSRTKMMPDIHIQ